MSYKHFHVDTSLQKHQHLVYINISLDIDPTQVGESLSCHLFFISAYSIIRIMWVVISGDAQDVLYFCISPMDTKNQ